MFEAINSFGGVFGVKAMLCSPPSSTVRTSVKWEGVSFVSNVQYSGDCLKIWRAYNIGSGIVLSWSKFDRLSKDEVPVSSILHKVHPIRLCYRQVGKTPDLEEEDVDNGADGPSNASKTPFACPEEECIKSYKRYFSLLKHMECGRHKLSLECETLYDRAMLGYASRLEHRTTAAPELGKAVFLPKFFSPISPNGMGAEMFSHPEYSVYCETGKVLKR